jgi:hypothetical protein
MNNQIVLCHKLLLSYTFQVPTHLTFRPCVTHCHCSDDDIDELDLLREKKKKVRLYSKRIKPFFS